MKLADWVKERKKKRDENYCGMTPPVNQMTHFGWDRKGSRKLWLSRNYVVEEGTRRVAQLRIGRHPAGEVWCWKA